jgi:hypothetical protein
MELLLKNRLPKWSGEYRAHIYVEGTNGLKPYRAETIKLCALLFLALPRALTRSPVMGA